ncbi:hypothetical protein EJB05_53496, partial [Eragrostis curvula]
MKKRCQAPLIAGETKSCTTSLKATVQSAMCMLGVGTGADNASGEPATCTGRWRRTSPARAGMPRQPYVVVAVTPVHGDQYVSCHTVPFPYAVYQCHLTLGLGGYGAYKVSLRGLRDGSAVDMLAFCHLDTSGWNPAHPAFEVLHTKPGGAPVCHFTSERVKRGVGDEVRFGRWVEVLCITSH